MAAAVALLLWGGFDQLHFYYANVAASLPALKRAAKWTPNDSALQLRLARAEASAGNSEAALQDLRQAANLNSRSTGIQQAYAQALIQAGKDAEAYALYQHVLAIAPRNTEALVNYGLLAHRLGHEAEAVDSWQRAVDVDPAEASAQLYLAQAREQEGEAATAARHYRAYLELVAKRPDQHRGENSTVLSALIKVADADAAAGQSKAALQGYFAAAQFAERSGEASLESLARAHAAEVLERTGNTAGAVRSYQASLKLDEQTGDTRAAAIDWLNYGQFLRRQKQPNALVLACFLKAEDLVRATPGKELTAITRERQAAEERLGIQSARVRSNLAELLAKATSLSLSDDAKLPS